jgi:hypothetical protein
MSMPTSVKISQAALISHRIHFDPFAAAKATNTRLPAVQIPATFWDGLQPTVNRITVKANSPLPRADVLVITWTTAEAQTLSSVFTSNHDFQATWYPYTYGAKPILAEIPAALLNEKANADSLGKGIIGYFNVVTVNGKTVVLFKSELHPSEDGNKLPVIALINQAAIEVAPSLLITTGTAGAIGSSLEAGDAVITNTARFYLTDPKSYAAFPGITNSLQLTAPAIHFSTTYITKCNQQITTLIEPDLTTIAKEKSYPGPTRNPVIYYNDVPGTRLFDVVSSNGFSLDDKNDTDGLQQLGSVNDMDDAFIIYGLSQNAATKSLPWLSVRNISEPQAPNLSKATQAEWEKIYDAFGMYTTYNSALACWAVICGL